MDDNKEKLKKLLTLEDVNLILLKTSPGVSLVVDSFIVEPFKETKGLLGDHLQLHIHTTNCAEEKKHEEKFFIKTLPSSETQRVFAIETGAFLKEHKFFTRIIPEMKRFGISLLEDITPKCYLSRLNDVAVFEDLSNLGFVTLDKRNSLSFECVKLVLKILGKLHASSLILEERVQSSFEGKMISSEGRKHEGTTNETYRMIQDFAGEFKESFYSECESTHLLLRSDVKGVKTEIDLFSSCNEDSKRRNEYSRRNENLQRNEDSRKKEDSRKEDEILKNKVEDYILKYPEWTKSSTKFRNVLCHGDLWATNLMFTFNEDGSPKECKMVDFQSYRYIPPAHDVFSFIYLSTNRKFRAEHLESLLKFYYEELGEILKSYEIDIGKVLPQEDFKESCSFYKKFAIVQSCTHFSSVMLNSDQLKSLFEDETASQKFFLEDRSDVILKVCSEDEVYRKKLEESIADLREVFAD